LKTSSLSTRRILLAIVVFLSATPDLD